MSLIFSTSIFALVGILISLTQARLLITKVSNSDPNITFGRNNCITFSKANLHNVAHIYLQAIPTILSHPSQCVFISEIERSTLFVKILEFFDVSFKIKKSTDESSDVFSGVIFSSHSKSSFPIVRKRVNIAVSRKCSCDQGLLQNQSFVTIFNRNSRRLHNYQMLLRKLEDNNITVRYIPSTSNPDQCWQFCTYITSSVVIAAYGAELAYPLIIGRPYISVIYSNFTDYFLNASLRHFNLTTLTRTVEAQTIQESDGEQCKRYWKYHIDVDAYWKHKCISLRLDENAIAKAVQIVVDLRK